jgi:hypothetical protein
LFNAYSADERNATQRSSTGVTEAGIKKIFQNYLFEKKFISANKETNVHVPSSITNGM